MLLPTPDPAPLARVSTVSFEILSIPLTMRVLHDADGKLVPVSTPGLRCDHMGGTPSVRKAKSEC